MCEQVNDYKHWCGNCQIRVYVQRHYGNLLRWQDCPYTCEYATAMRCSIKPFDNAVTQVGKEHGTAETVERIQNEREMGTDSV